VQTTKKHFGKRSLATEKKQYYGFRVLARLVRWCNTSMRLKQVLMYQNSINGRRRCFKR
jgi:hypothetical protein